MCSDPCLDIKYIVCKLNSRVTINIHSLCNNGHPIHRELILVLYALFAYCTVYFVEDNILSYY